MILTYNGSKIQQREEDLFVNATQMCASNGKKVNDWLRLEQTKAYIKGISSVTGIEVADLIETRRGGHTNGQGTWIHPELVNELEHWLNKNKSEQNIVVGDIYIYCDYGNNAYKIGFTTNLIKREKQHKTSNPFLKLIKVYPSQQIDNEQLLHEKLKKYQIKGTTEWYSKNPQVLKIVDLFLAVY